MSPLFRIALAAAAGYVVASRINVSTSGDCREDEAGQVQCEPSSTPKWIAFVLVGTAAWFVLPVLTGSKSYIGGHSSPRQLSGLDDDGPGCGCGD